MAHESKTRLGLPALGVGVGLRRSHFRSVLDPRSEEEQRAALEVQWLEVITENYLGSRGWPRRVLDRVRERYPVVFHGVSLNIGSSDPLDADYLQRLHELADEIEPAWISDHVCWTGVAGKNTHDLLPLPYTEEMLAHIVARVARVQDLFGRRLVLENPSTYLEFCSSSLDEAEFLARLAEEADCGLLLDVNNVCVSCFNHGWDPYDYVARLPLERVCQFHVAGHTDLGSHRIDTHDRPVAAEVWRLLRHVAQHTVDVPVLVEWDANLPAFPRLVEEALRAREVCRGAAVDDVDAPSAPETWPQPLHVVTPQLEESA